MRIKFNNREFEVDDVENAESFFQKVRGLTFRRKDRSNALLFNYQGGLHSFFVFFHFIVLWLDDKNNMVDFKVASPFSLSIYTRKKFSKILEIPINGKYSDIVNFIVGRKI